MKEGKTKHGAKFGSYLFLKIIFANYVMINLDLRKIFVYLNKSQYWLRGASKHSETAENEA